MEENAKSRLLLVIKELQLSQRKFEEQAKLSNGYIRNLKASPSSAVLQKIFSAFPKINKDWVIYGNGDMFDKQTRPTSNTGIPQEKLVPLIPVSSRTDRFDKFYLSVRREECKQLYSPVNGADIAVPITEESMAPEYSNGSIVFLKKLDDNAFIEWGKVYMLNTNNGPIIKKLMPVGNDNSRVSCVSINPEYPPFLVTLKDIYGVYKVLACLSIK